MSRENNSVNDLIRRQKFVSTKEIFSSSSSSSKKLTSTPHSTPQHETSLSTHNIELRKLGERFCYELLKRRHPTAKIEWLNKNNIESGYPYDIKLIDTLTGQTQYIEVKATNCAHMSWFYLTQKEFKCMMEKKENYIFYLVSVKTGEWTRIEQAYLKLGHAHFTHSEKNCFRIEPSSYRVEFISESRQMDMTET